MPSLLDRFDALPAESSPGRTEAEHRLIEQLTFSSVPEILAFLEGALGRDLLLLPVWLRNLAYRLACLQAPQEEALLRRAAADLRFVGPDWDTEVRALLERADALRG